MEVEVMEIVLLWKSSTEHALDNPTVIMSDIAHCLWYIYCVRIFGIWLWSVLR
jgi:uncharacterized protein with PQ loop repeat